MNSVYQFGSTMSWLVVGPPLWKIWKSIGMIVPNIWENKKWQPNHQPVRGYKPLRSNPFCSTQINLQKIQRPPHWSMFKQLEWVTSNSKMFTVTWCCLDLAKFWFLWFSQLHDVTWICKNLVHMMFYNAPSLSMDFHGDFRCFFWSRDPHPTPNLLLSSASSALSCHGISKPNWSPCPLMGIWLPYFPLHVTLSHRCFFFKHIPTCCFQICSFLLSLLMFTPFCWVSLNKTLGVPGFWVSPHCEQLLDSDALAWWGLPAGMSARLLRLKGPGVGSMGLTQDIWPIFRNPVEAENPFVSFRSKTRGVVLNFEGIHHEKPEHFYHVLFTGWGFRAPMPSPQGGIWSRTRLELLGFSFRLRVRKNARCVSQLGVSHGLADPDTTSPRHHVTSFKVFVRDFSDTPSLYP